MQPRVVGLIAVLSVATGWLKTSLVSPDAPAAAPIEAARPRTVAAQSSPAAYTQQLRLKLRQLPPSPSRGRNPFTFGARRSSVSEHARAPEAEAALPEPVAAPTAPVFRFDLTGIATTRQDGTDVFTAILNDNGSLVFVKAGDALSNGHSVVRVDEMSVVIADASGAERVIRLK